mmetsp:Transcript_17811/g.43601  ORF Transcript_17811/g.43601 Transcript_17811/m.43601 type:complete len:215 (-) Transcript_17811:580-1224(-)
MRMSTPLLPPPLATSFRAFEDDMPSSSPIPRYDTSSAIRASCSAWKERWPIQAATVSPRGGANLFSTALTCNARSLVGTIMIARSLLTALPQRELMTGSVYASVFPLPVGAETHRSWSNRHCNAIGTTAAWTAKSSEIPLSLSASTTESFKPTSSTPTPPASRSIVASSPVSITGVLLFLALSLNFPSFWSESTARMPLGSCFSSSCTSSNGRT